MRLSCLSLATGFVLATATVVHADTFQGFTTAVPVQVADPEFLNSAAATAGLPADSDFTHTVSATSSYPELYSSEFLGTGEIDLKVIADAGSWYGTQYGSTTNLSGTVAYDYTPAAAPVSTVPEPSGIALIGTMAMVGAQILRRKFSKN